MLRGSVLISLILGVAASTGCSADADGKSTCQGQDQTALLQGRVQVSTNQDSVLKSGATQSFEPPSVSDGADDLHCPAGSVTSEATGACVDKPWDDFVSCADEALKGDCVNPQKGDFVNEHCMESCQSAYAGPSSSSGGEAMLGMVQAEQGACKDANFCKYYTKYLENNGPWCSWAAKYCPNPCGLCGKSFTCKCSDPNGRPGKDFSEGCTADGQDKCVCKEGYSNSYYHPICKADQCQCPKRNSFNDVEPATAAKGPACWQNGREGCMKQCSSQDCDAKYPFFKKSSVGKQCAGKGLGILGSGCCTPSECCGTTTDKMWGDDAAPIPVDFYIFKSSSGSLPQSTSNIGGVDGCSGFSRRCAGTNGQFSYNKKVAELNVVDLNIDFAELVPDGQKGPTFVLGNYKEVTGDTSVGNIDDLIAMAGKEKMEGHELLKKLTYDTKDSDAFYPKPGRISVWVPDTDVKTQHCSGTKCYTMVLLGSTYLGMSASSAQKTGPGILLSGEVQRRGRRLQHEVGHVVGFPHAHWQDMTPCESNIMGGKGGVCPGSPPTPQFTFTAGATNNEKYPKIFANWRHQRVGGSADNRPHPEVSLLESGASHQVTEDVAVNCKDVVATHGPEFLHELKQEMHVRCQDSV